MGIEEDEMVPRARGQSRKREKRRRMGGDRSGILQNGAGGWRKQEE